MGLFGLTFASRKRATFFLNAFKLSCVDNAKHHKKKVPTRDKKNLHSHVSISQYALVEKFEIEKKKCIDFHSNFNCLGRQPLRDRFRQWFSSRNLVALIAFCSQIIVSFGFFFFRILVRILNKRLITKKWDNF